MMRHALFLSSSSNHTMRHRPALALLLIASATCVEVARPPRAHRRPALQQQQRSTSFRSASRADVPSAQLVAMGGGWQAAGGVAGLAIASEVIQIVNTFVALLIFNRATGASSFVGLVETFASFFVSLGVVAYPAYAALLLSITVLPVMSAILFIVLSGSVFGPVRGTIVVSLSLSSAAAISATITRRLAAARHYGLSSIDPRAAAVDAAIAKKPTHTSLLLVTLLRLSPVLPFTFSNYLAGLTSLPIWVIFIGTLLGTLPTQVCPPSPAHMPSSHATVVAPPHTHAAATVSPFPSLEPPLMQRMSGVIHPRAPPLMSAPTASHIGCLRGSGGDRPAGAAGRRQVTALGRRARGLGDDLRHPSDWPRGAADAR